VSRQRDERISRRVRWELWADKTKREQRVHEGDFSRKPILTLPRVAAMILRGHHVSQQNGLNKMFRELDEMSQLPTAAAYCQARRKVKPELFVRLNSIVVEEFTLASEEEGVLRDWHGHRLLGADGTKLALPDTPQMRASFTVARNQTDEWVQGLAVVVYDLLHDFCIAAELGPVKYEVEVLMQRLWQNIGETDVLVLDRGFEDYKLLSWAAKTNRHLIMRCTRQSFAAVNQFWESNQLEKVVRLRCSEHKETRDYVKEHGLPQEVLVRLLKFRLPNGQYEVLLTTLVDRHEYKRKEFYEVYGWRWRHESYYDRIKNIFELERFSGTTDQTVRQDFYGILFLASYESALAQSAQEEMDEEQALKQEQKRLLKEQRAAAATTTTTDATAEDKLKASSSAPQPPQVNRAVSYVSLLDHTVGLLADARVEVKDVLDELRVLLLTDPVRHPQKRKFPPRKPRSVARSLRYQKYGKRLTA
jgi:Transposase DDE domain